LETALIVIGFLFCVLGIIGSFLPVLPGPFTSWIGLLLLHLTDVIPDNWSFLGITLVIALVVWVLDYVVPAIGAKRFGGTKYGMIGSSVGLIVGLLFLGPFGIIVGPFAGAFLGELIKDSDDSSRALKAAFGSFIGFLAGTVLKLIVTIWYIILFISKVSEHTDEIF